MGQRPRPWFERSGRAARFAQDPSGPQAARGIIDHVVITGTLTSSVGDTEQLTATAYDRGGNVISGVGVAWFSSQPVFASITARGVLSFLVPGVTTITALVDGRPYTAIATILPGSAFALLTQDATALLAQDGSELSTQGL